MRLVTFQRLNNNGAFDESAPVMPLFGIGAPMREQESRSGLFSFFGEEVGILSRDGTRVLPIAETGISYPDMNALIVGLLPEEMEVLRDAAQAFEMAASDTEYADSEEGSEENRGLCVGRDVKILSPIPVPLQDVKLQASRYLNNTVPSIVAVVRHDIRHAETVASINLKELVREGKAERQREIELLDVDAYIGEVAGIVISRSIAGIDAYGGGRNLRKLFQCQTAQSDDAHQHHQHAYHS